MGILGRSALSPPHKRGRGMLPLDQHAGLMSGSSLGALD